MALKTFTNSTTIQSGFVLKLTITEDSIDTSTNKSSCTATLQLIIDSGASVSGSYVDYSLSGDTSVSGGGGSAYFNSGTHTLLTKTYTKSHSDDGTGSTSVTGTLNIPAVGWNNRTVTTSGTLTNIPRGFTTKPKVSLASATDKSITIKWETSENCDRVDYNISGTSVQNAWTGNAKTGNITISNLREGKTYAVYIWCRKRDSQVGQISDTKNMNTYAKPTNTLNTKTETTIKVNWSAGDYIDRIRYSSDNGSTWSEWSTVNAKSGNYTISGLNAKKDYNIKTELRWKSNNNITSTTDKLAVTTYQYPYLKSIGTSDLNVGASTLTQTFKLYNPLNRSATIYMKLANNTVINCGSTTNGTDVAYTYTFTTANKNAMNSSITNTTLTKNATYYCTYSSQTVSTVSGKYHIDSSDTNYKPTFSTSNWSYTTNYVKNDTVVANKSTITVNVNTSATPKTGATITGYTIKWGNQTKNIDGTTGNVTTETDSATILKVIAEDSRGFTTETSRTVPVIDYTDPTCVIDADRTDGVGTDVFLSLNGTYKVVQLYTNSTTKADNTILSVKYAISTTTSYDDVDDYTIPLSSVTINNGSYSLNNYQIYSDGSSAGFTIGTRYNIRIKIQDRYYSSSNPKILYGTITDGKIAVDCYQDSEGEYHRGINGLANSNYTEYINGDFGVTRGNKVDVGSGGINGSTQHDDLFVYNTGGWIYVRPKGKEDSTNQFTFKNTGVLLIPIALQIPKNGNDGYGLCNSSGTSIIRDHNNQNVTIDATGKKLILGYQNTTGIEIIPNIISDVTIDHGNSSNHYLYIGNTSNKNLNEVRTRNNTLDIGMGVDNGGTYRIWNYTHSKEVIRISSAGVNSFNGNASTSTKATQDGSGNTITSTYLMKKNVARGRVSITPSAANTPTSAVVSWGKTMDGEPTCTATVNSSASQVINTAVTGLSSTGGTIWLLSSNTTARNVFYIAIYV